MSSGRHRAPRTPPPDLRAIQTWMQAVIVNGTDPGAELERIVHRDRGVSAKQRLDIYARGYRLRLLECMRADYPVLRRFVGEELFDHFATEYLSARPSSSYTLYALGSGFAQHLADSRPPLDVPSAQRTLFDLPIELARLERCVAEVGRGPGFEKSTPSLVDATALLPNAALEDDLLLRSNPSLRLLEMSFPLVELWRTHHRKKAVELPPPQATIHAICRKDYRVLVHRLEPWQGCYLRAVQSMQETAQSNGGPSLSTARNSPEPTGSCIGTTIDKAVAAGVWTSSFLRARLAYWLPVAFLRGYLLPSRK